MNIKCLFGHDAQICTKQCHHISQACCKEYNCPHSQTHSCSVLNQDQFFRCLLENKKFINYCSNLKNRYQQLIDYLISKRNLIEKQQKLFGMFQYELKIIQSKQYDEKCHIDSNVTNRLLKFLNFDENLKQSLQYIGKCIKKINHQLEIISDQLQTNVMKIINKLQEKTSAKINYYKNEKTAYLIQPNIKKDSKVKILLKQGTDNLKLGIFKKDVANTNHSQCIFEINKNGQFRGINNTACISNQFCQKFHFTDYNIIQIYFNLKHRQLKLKNQYTSVQYMIDIKDQIDNDQLFFGVIFSGIGSIFLLQE